MQPLIRPEQPEDEPAIATVLQAAFGQEDEARLVEQIRRSDRYHPELSLVSEIAGTITGHILFSTVDLVGTQVFPVLALAPLAVHPHYQGQGIGSALVQAGLTKAQQQAKADLIVVLGHANFYARFGFEIAASFGIECPFPVPNEVYRVYWLTDDRSRYQGKIIYPAAFTLEHDS